MTCFQYLVIRYVPNIARGEFINFGLVAGCDELNNWEVKFITNSPRACALGDARSFEHAVQFVADLKILDGKWTERELLRLHTDYNNLIQFSKPLPCIANSASGAISKLWDTFVLP